MPHFNSLVFLEKLLILEFQIPFTLVSEHVVLLQFSSVSQSCPTPWTAAHQASLSITNSWSLPKLMSIESVMLSNRLILCCPLLLLPSIFPNIRVSSNESALHIRWPNYWSFSFSISPSNEYSGLNPMNSMKRHIFIIYCNKKII